MQGVKEKFEKAAQMIWKKSFKDLDHDKQKRIRYLVCTETAIAEEKEVREKKRLKEKAEAKKI